MPEREIGAIGGRLRLQFQDVAVPVCVGTHTESQVPIKAGSSAYPVSPDCPEHVSMRSASLIHEVRSTFLAGGWFLPFR